MNQWCLQMRSRRWTGGEGFSSCRHGILFDLACHPIRPSFWLFSFFFLKFLLFINIFFYFISKSIRSFFELKEASKSLSKSCFAPFCNSVFTNRTLFITFHHFSSFFWGMIGMVLADPAAQARFRAIPGSSTLSALGPRPAPEDDLKQWKIQQGAMSDLVETKEKHEKQLAGKMVKSTILSGLVQVVQPLHLSWHWGLLFLHSVAWRAGRHSAQQELLWFSSSWCLGLAFSAFIDFLLPFRTRLQRTIPLISFLKKGFKQLA